MWARMERKSKEGWRLVWLKLILDQIIPIIKKDRKYILDQILLFLCEFLLFLNQILLIFNKIAVLDVKFI